ncbi:MAG: hypothetical protein CGU28_00355 [Candidatus Dactylopiibacterium carminicum]|uniref:Uncharacterized protein n=1 Tax=Candidatus Dactylopiibacterium carminicum TaxID=857335 RepID=A0A272F0F2_9RHOO|nr:YihY family inner membrane protein [Candidatus Dactylopiibacterium carminicum]KAF7600851.1 hypothetical protein BGI27_00420 [Candidatus Dactylopiibacterium carminicum]PAS95350.1 MAG: hypothetical protein CGU29_00455 [Candidatus Dactylopiibacterium carminicum]PAS98639.1 MAG: hypothetical protein CGU28_00355 [Candidatus Dactylopiibacterium carminicum]
MQLIRRLTQLRPPADSPLYQLSLLVLYKFRSVRVMQTAGALTYTTLLSLVPMITVVLAVMRQFSPFMKLGEGLRGFLLANLLPERAGKVVATYALQFSEKASSLTVVGAGFLLLTAVMLLSTIDRTINSIWAVRKPRAWYVRFPVYWVALTLGPVLFAAGVAATSEVVSVSMGVVQQDGWLRSMIDRLATAALLSALCAYMFHVIPNRRLVLWHGVIGGLVAGFGVMLVQRMFGFYISRLPNFTLIYGTFSVLPIFLIWVYLTWLTILLGATVAAVLPEFRARHERLPDTPAGQLLAALYLAQALIAAQQAGRAVSRSRLAQACRRSPEQTEAMLLAMQQAGWVLRSENEAWALSIPGDRLQLGALHDCLVLQLQAGGEHAAGLNAADQLLLQQAREQMQAGAPQAVSGLFYKG